jgi:5'-3' exonuclease
VRLHLIDGTYELFRAHFSRRPDHRDPNGNDAKATVGVVLSILALLRDPEERATHLGVAFDNPIRSFRNDLFAGYKSDEGIPPELYRQFNPVEAAMRAIGVVVWSMKEWEADDALATAAARWGGEVEQVRIMTPDKDLGQCLVEGRVVQIDRMRKKEWTVTTLREERGVAPESIPDYLALVGDTADGIPGIPGFGKKTAAALLAEYGHIEGIPARAADWRPSLRGADVLAATLQESLEQALLYRRLATLVRTVPLHESLDDLRWRGVPREAFDAWCREVDAPSDLVRLAQQQPQV